MISTASLRCEAVHDGLHDARDSGVIGAAGFARLEEDVRILRGAAKEGPIGAERVLAELDDVFVVDQRADRLVADGENFADFVRGAEAIEEMNERNARLEGGDLCDERHVGDFLHGVRCEHRPSGGAASHHVGVIAENRKRVGGQGASRYVHGGRRQFTGDLVHVGNHQQQALRGRKRGAECTGLQRTMQCAGSAAFTLQLFYDGQCAPDILLPFRAPLIGPLGHGRRGGNRIDCNDFGETIGYRGSRLVPI